MCRDYLVARAWLAKVASVPGIPPKVATAAAKTMQLVMEREASGEHRPSVAPVLRIILVEYSK